MPHLLDVLILIVMDVPLGVKTKDASAGITIVLILIVMDVPLGDSAKYIIIYFLAKS